MKENLTKLNNSLEIKEFASQHKFDWYFAAPDAPWQNGCAEAMVKAVKKAIKVAIGD